MAFALRRPIAVQLPPAVARWSAALSAVILFPIAIQVLQAGAGALAHPLRERLLGASPSSMLGVGWLASLLALSGSPVAAAALALFNRGALDELQCFTMIVGTRFGAIFVALALAALYAYRPGARRPGIPAVESMSRGGTSSLAIGLLACLTTMVVGWLSLALGLVLLPRQLFLVTLPVKLLAGIDRLTDPIVRGLTAHAPGWLVFLLGLGAVLGAFKLIDLALPVASRDDTPRQLREHLTSRAFMFLCGILVTLVTPSVTVSVGLLVPLHAKGHMRGARLVPYVLGANIAAFSDTLLAALMLGDPRATSIVLTEIVSIAAVSIAILTLGHDSLERTLVRASEAMVRDRRALFAFLAASLAQPLALLLL